MSSAAIGLGTMQPQGTGPVHPPWLQRHWSWVPVRVWHQGQWAGEGGVPAPAGPRESYICPVGAAACGAVGAATRCKVARSGLLLCRGHKGKCWVQRLGTGPGRGFQLAQRFAGCDDWAAVQTLMSWQFLCAPARGSALARL